MDWNALKQKTSSYLQKATPYVEKAKQYGGKALDFTQKQIQNTPIVLKTVAEYETLVVDAKRLILIGYDETNPLSQELLLWTPVWSTQAWSDNASLRFFSLQTSPEIARQFGFTSGVDMRVFYVGEETLHLTDMGTIKTWWKNRYYDGNIPEEKPSSTTETPIPEDKNPIEDPLNQK
ncbi:MAG: hypothetical protein PHY14_04530 [Candidatus Gracilibacteria bacterium]|nr:hypothetical protein [Candidatus Gracilibacteria bacterium]